MKLTLLNWVKAALAPTPATPFEVIFAGAEGPRPARPYATLEVLSEGPVGTPHTVVTDDDGEDGLCLHSIESHRRGTFSVAIYADDHRELATQLELAVDDPALQEQLDAAGVVVVGPIGAMDYSRVIRATSFESFSVIDFSYGCRASRASRIAVIETAEVTHNG